MSTPGPRPRDCYNPRHLRPYVGGESKLEGSADMLVIENVCVPIVTATIHDDMANDDVAWIVNAAGERV